MYTFNHRKHTCPNLNPTETSSPKRRSSWNRPRPDDVSRSSIWVEDAMRMLRGRVRPSLYRARRIRSSPRHLHSKRLVLPSPSKKLIFVSSSISDVMTKRVVCTANPSRVITFDSSYVFKIQLDLEDRIIIPLVVSPKKKVNPKFRGQIWVETWRCWGKSGFSCATTNPKWE